MNDRVAIVPQDAAIVQHPSTTILHTYANGLLLIRTHAVERDRQEQPQTQGLQLTDATPDDLAIARDTLRIVPESNGRAAIAEFTNPQPILAYVELIGPVDPVWLQRLRTIDIEPLRYQPEHSYLCRGSAIAFTQALDEPFILQITPLMEGMKPKVDVIAEDGEDVLIVVQATLAEAPAIQRELAEIEGVELQPDVEAIDIYLRLRARITADGQTELLARSRVVAIEPDTAPRPEDEIAGLILTGQYDVAGKPNGSFLRWLTDHGINGEGVTIGIVDNGVDVTHPAFKNRIKDLTDGKKSWHGTGVAGHAAGNYLMEKDQNQFIYGVGMAPAANLLVQDNTNSATMLCKQTVTERPPSGMPGTVQNNSWGKGTRNPMDYSSDEALYDQLVRNADPTSATSKPLTICFSSGNSGDKGLTRPKAAKNLIVTGNSKSYRPDRGRDQSDNIRQIYSGPRASSWGNCGDGRIRPHIVAPGEWTATANYDSHNGDPEYISPAITFVGGSSAASPKTAGVCALLTQWWRQHNYGQTPSPAMLRALLVNGAEPIESGGSIPNNIQGWGRLNLENILSEAVPHFYLDQTLLLSKLGDEKVWHIRVGNPQAPVKITLNYTDPPGPIGSGGKPTVSPIVNKLALRVEVNGKLYRANQFQNGWSSPNGPSDRESTDNLQNIYLPAGIAIDTLKVTVTALNITTNCLTGAIDTPQQDFALVITNGQLDSTSTPADVFVAIAKPQPPQPQTPADWWNQTDPQWLMPETDRASSRGLTTGIDILLQSGDHQIHLATDPTQPETDRIEAVDLSIALRQLMQTWDGFGYTTGSLLRRRAAVIVINSQTALSQDDLDALRRLTWMGTLYLVSADAIALSRLAQQIHRRQGIQFRLANQPEELAQLVRDTLAEIGGAQPVGIMMRTETTDKGLLTQFAFSVLDRDRHLTLRLRYPTSPTSLELLRPGEDAIALDPKPQFDWDTAPDHWAGRWILRILQPAETMPPALNVWAKGNLALSLSDQPEAALAAGRENSTLLTLQSHADLQLTRSLIPPPRIATLEPQPHSESDRDLVLTPPVSRLSQELASAEADATSETDRDIPASSALSQWLALPPTPTGARVLDMPVQVLGLDRAGNPFARLVRYNRIDLQPRSQQPPEPPLLFVSAEVAEVLWKGDRVIGLRVQKRDRQRLVHATDPILQTELAVIAQTLKTGIWHFGVIGDQLVKLLRCFDGKLPYQV